MRQRLEPLRQRVPCRVVMDVDFLLFVLRAHGVVHRPHRLAFAEDLERDALPEVALRAAVHEQAPLRTHQVDEAGCNHLTVYVEFALSSRTIQIADLRDMVALDRYAPRNASSAAAIADESVAQDNIVVWGPSAGSENDDRRSREEKVEIAQMTSACSRNDNSCVDSFSKDLEARRTCALVAPPVRHRPRRWVLCRPAWLTRCRFL